MIRSGKSQYSEQDCKRRYKSKPSAELKSSLENLTERGAFENILRARQEVVSEEQGLSFIRKAQSFWR